MQKVQELFQLIDYDKSKGLIKQETLQFWADAFPKINTKEIFSHVDYNRDGEIKFGDEWLRFWTKVYNSGYSEDEIINEIEIMKKGGSWVQFNKKNKK